MDSESTTPYPPDPAPTGPPTENTVPYPSDLGANGPLAPMNTTPYPPDPGPTVPANTVPAAEPPPYSPPMTGYPPPSMAYPPVPAQPGFSPAIYQTAPPQNDAVIRATQHQTVTTTQVLVDIPKCPQCRVGTLQETFTPLGICCAVFLFPIGILFCLMMRRKICPHCGAVFM